MDHVAHIFKKKEHFQINLGILIQGYIGGKQHKYYLKHGYLFMYF